MYVRYRGLHGSKYFMLCRTSLFIFTLCRHVTFYKTLTSLSTVFIKPHVGLLQLLKWLCRTSFFTLDMVVQWITLYLHTIAVEYRPVLEVLKILNSNFGPKSNPWPITSTGGSKFRIYIYIFFSTLALETIRVMPTAYLDAHVRGTASAQGIIPHLSVALPKMPV